MDIIKNFPLSHWENPYNLWTVVASFIPLDEVEGIIELLRIRTENVALPPWQMDILADDFNLFSQEYVNILFNLTRERKALSYSGALFTVPKDIKTIGSEIFDRIADSFGPDRLRIFERAYTALKDDPTLNYEYWFSFRLRVGFESELDDSVIHAAVQISPYAKEPIYIIDGFFNTDKIIENATLKVPEYVNGNVEIHKRNYIKYKTLQTQLRLALQDSLELFRSFGPVNVAVAMDFTDNINCSKYGGCRMLLCDCYDKEWFKGFCEVCLQKIKNKRWAIRAPKITGSWTGCYCSPGCTVYNLQEKGDPLEILIFSQFWNQIKENGIFNEE